MNAHEVLVAARNYLSDPARWIKGALDDGDGNTAGAAVCTVGALAIAQDGDVFGDWEGPAHDALVSVVGAKFLPDWNDARERTHAEVLAAFDKAISATAPDPDTSFLAEVEEAIPA